MDLSGFVTASLVDSWQWPSLLQPVLTVVFKAQHRNFASLGFVGLKPQLVEELAFEFEKQAEL